MRRNLSISGHIFGFDLRFWRSNLGSFLNLKTDNSFSFNTFFGSFPLNRIFLAF